MNAEDARRTARSYLDQQFVDTADDTLDLHEFDGGWLVLVRGSGGRAAARGSAPLVVDREDGRVRAFPSALPPRVIMRRYADLRG